MNFREHEHHKKRQLKYNSVKFIKTSREVVKSQKIIISVSLDSQWDLAKMGEKAGKKTTK